MNKKVTGAWLATAVASFVLTAPAIAEPKASTGKVKCAGIHSCKGNSDRKGNGNTKCKGHNTWAPYGWTQAPLKHVRTRAVRSLKANASLPGFWTWPAHRLT